MSIDKIAQASVAYTQNLKLPKAEALESNDKVALFKNFLTQNIKDDFSRIAKADQIAIQSLQGKADVTQVVVAFAEAEQIVNKVVAIKQSLLTVINDIMKLSF
ncbi:flagellar hook-basal body complex protein FliE [Rickettsiales endosymbiont of Stachyamoeba lipophora]|uniref:flagellar hook-basal body complex protein FliE n=1 Tax=Rickettsiales endosymbiont of Stachyamoeba lipophora TaxID=2486578 RepID=UPI000F64E9FA|nr:flagellar hook-basal body complex protein FliE [Rickettsiales endosymbiont of Stachyamoeba lipophora]AZL15301.1 hypothetical protein EF513_01855 [Rickettsiales endosymbiont of Stachyamoeba lipophora]